MALAPAWLAPDLVVGALASPAWLLADCVARLGFLICFVSGAAAVSAAAALTFDGLGGLLIVWVCALRLA